MNWLGWCAILTFLGIALIRVQRDHQNIQRFWVPQHQVQNVANWMFIVGGVFLGIAAVLFFRNVGLPLIISGFLAVCVIVSFSIIISQGNAYMTGDPAQRASISWSLRSFWVPFLITVLIIIFFAASGC